jgi:hypothetical protein
MMRLTGRWTAEVIDLPGVLAKPAWGSEPFAESVTSEILTSPNS